MDRKQRGKDFSHENGPPRFIGGAERARRRAQSKGWEPPSRKRRRLQREEEERQQPRWRGRIHGRRSNQSTDNHLPPPSRLSTKKLRSSERFFAALLDARNVSTWHRTNHKTRSTPSGQRINQETALEHICGRLGIGPVPPIPSSHSGREATHPNHLPHTEDPRRFFASRAVLVMEDARHELTEALEKENHGTGRGQRQKNSWTDAKLESVELDEKRTGFLRLGLAKATGRFSREELLEHRPGSCFELEASTARTSTTMSTPTHDAKLRLLGSVAPGKPGSFQLVLIVYEEAAVESLLSLLGAAENENECGDLDGATNDPVRNDPKARRVRFRMRFCVSLIGHCRQFEACDFGCSGHHRGGVLRKHLMGQKQATHIRFCDSEEEEEEERDTATGSGAACEEGAEEIVGYVTDETDPNDEKEADRKNEGNDDGGNNFDSEWNDTNGVVAGNQQRSRLHLTMASFTGLKSLNATQEKAAQAFCSSDESQARLDLIQGPPGTGKTTFVVSVLARLLCSPRPKGQRRPRRILVTAPTNKAVGVMARRFLEACPGLLDEHGIPVALIGVQDKLLEQDDNEKLRRIFCYTWLEALAEEYGGLLEDLSKTQAAAGSEAHEKTELTTLANRGVSSWLSRAFPPGKSESLMVGDDSDSDTEDEDDEKRQNVHILDTTHRNGWCVSLYAQVRRLHIRLVRNLPRWSEASGAANLSRKLVGFLEKGDLSAAAAYIQTLQKVLKDNSAENDSDDEGDDEEMSARAADAVPELLASARVIFCTLSTAGTSLMKQTRRVDDWIVDEAAAATEPELLIPLHLDPRRMLAVGDPRQLPASVASPLAERWGLGRSLHERLTVDLGRSQTMLDVQYRMKPQIAQFPSHQFYGGKLTNGENVRDVAYGASQFNPDGTGSRDLLQCTPPFCFFHVNGKEKQSHTGSYYNIEEASALVTLLKMLQKRNHKAMGIKSWCSPDKIRVITFYSAQVVTLRQILRRKGLQEVLVATVDSSQGCEADMVVLSFVRTTGAGFLRDDRRMNVALTRARHKLVCLANVTDSSWASDQFGSSVSSTLSNLLGEARTRGCLSLALSEK